MTICRTEIVKLDPAVMKHLVSKENIARSLMYHRSKPRSPLPRTAVDLEIPEYLAKTKSTERFILHSSITADDAILIFGFLY